MCFIRFLSRPIAFRRIQEYVIRGVFFMVPLEVISLHTVRVMLPEIKIPFACLAFGEGTCKPMLAVP